jgi:hypothetical protein
MTMIKYLLSVVVSLISIPFVVTFQINLCMIKIFKWILYKITNDKIYTTYN